MYKQTTMADEEKKGKPGNRKRVVGGSSRQVVLVLGGVDTRTGAKRTTVLFQNFEHTFFDYDSHVNVE